MCILTGSYPRPFVSLRWHDDYLLPLNISKVDMANKAVTVRAHLAGDPCTAGGYGQLLKYLVRGKGEARHGVDVDVAATGEGGTPAQPPPYHASPNTNTSTPSDVHSRDDKTSVSFNWTSVPRSVPIQHYRNSPGNLANNKMYQAFMALTGGLASAAKSSLATPAPQYCSAPGDLYQDADMPWILPGPRLRTEVKTPHNAAGTKTQPYAAKDTYYQRQKTILAKTTGKQYESMGGASPQCLRTPSVVSRPWPCLTTYNASSPSSSSASGGFRFGATGPRIWYSFDATSAAAAAGFDFTGLGAGNDRAQWKKANSTAAAASSMTEIEAAVAQQFWTTKVAQLFEKVSKTPASHKQFPGLPWGSYQKDCGSNCPGAGNMTCTITNTYDITCPCTQTQPDKFTSSYTTVKQPDICIMKTLKDALRLPCLGDIKNDPSYGFYAQSPYRTLVCEGGRGEDPVFEQSGDYMSRVWLDGRAPGSSAFPGIVDAKTVGKKGSTAGKGMAGLFSPAAATVSTDVNKVVLANQLVLKSKMVDRESLPCNMACDTQDDPRWMTFGRRGQQESSIPNWDSESGTTKKSPEPYSDETPLQLGSTDDQNERWYPAQKAFYADAAAAGVPDSAVGGAVGGADYAREVYASLFPDAGVHFAQADVATLTLHYDLYVEKS